MLEDAILTAGIYTLRDSKLRQLFQPIFPGGDDGTIELYSVAEWDRFQLYEACKSIKNKWKIVLTVFQGSALEKQWNRLAQFNVESEVCLSKVIRNPLAGFSGSAW